LGTRTTTEVPANKLKPLLARLDDTPLLQESDLALCRWLADYYHHSPGEVLEHLLPTMLRRGCGLSEADERGWESTGQEPAKPLRGSKQQALWALFQQQPQQLHADLTARSEERRVGKQWSSRKSRSR